MNASADDYRLYLQDQSRQHKSTCTVARRLAAIRVFLRYLGEHGHDISGILQQLERPKPERSLPQVLSKTQVVRLIGAPGGGIAVLFAGCGGSWNCSTPAACAPANYPTSSSAMSTSRSVACGSWARGMKERIVPLGRAAIEAIERYITECRPGLDRRGSDLLFLSRTGKPLGRIALWMLVRKHAKACGLLKEVHPHVLRHCFASHLLSGGADLRIVQELLGHADIATTQIYTHVDVDRIKEIHRKFHPHGKMNDEPRNH